MGRFHVGSDPAEDDDDPALSSPPAPAAAAACAGPNVEAMEVDEHDLAAGSANPNDGGSNDDEEAEPPGGGREPWEDRCHDENGRSEPVSTPPLPPPPSDDDDHGSSSAVVPYDPDQAAAEELAAQMDREYDRRCRTYSQEHEHRPEYDYHQGDGQDDQEEERERQARIDTRMRMLWGGRGGSQSRQRRRRGDADGDEEEEEDDDENDDRRVGGHVLGGGGYNMSNGGGGAAPPYSATIYGHGYGYHQGGQQYNDGGAMMASYNGNGDPYAFHQQQNGNFYTSTDNSQPGLLQRLRRSRPIVRYSLIVLFGILVSYLSRRAPPPPPPHYDWTSYIVHSTHSILGEVERVSHDTAYILGGFVRNVYQDAIELKDAMPFGFDGDGVGGGRSGGRCVLRLPTFPTDESTSDIIGTSDTTSYIEGRLGENIFGQGRAIRVISRALEAWEGPSGSTVADNQGECTPNSDDDNSETCKAPLSSANHHQDGGKPLALMLAGPEGTGKSETARLVARLVFPDCLGSGNIAAGDSIPSAGPQNIHYAAVPRGVLFIDGRSYSDVDGQQPEGYAYHQRTRAFSDRIVGHIQKQRGAGAVIIISQIEDVSPSIAGELVRLIRSSSSARISNNDSSERVLVGEKGAQWNNVLFLFTSYLGADKLFQLIHTYEGIEYISDADLTTTVRNEIDSHFGSSTGLGNAINAVATFMPLEAEQMEDVLYRKISELSQKHEGSLWKRLDVTEQALSYFAGPDHNEYLSLKNRETGSIIFSFSKRGAHTLDDDVLLQTLRSVRRHMPVRPDKIAVFDYDLNSNQATISWCTDDESNQSSASRRRRVDVSTYNCAGKVAWKGDLK